jgi:uncharacterized protein (DUF302 family)
MTPDGLIARRSDFGWAETSDRLVAAVAESGMLVVARIDHARAAADIGQSLRPTQVIVFGNPKAGTPLMQAKQTTGIDLPLKALVWEDAEGVTWVTYNDPHWIAGRHGLDASAIVTAMGVALETVVSHATRSDAAAAVP